MKTDILQIEIDLLLLKYGEPSVVKALALSLNYSEEEMRGKIEILRAKNDKPLKTPRTKKIPLEVAKEVVAGAENEELLTNLSILYQNKQFLPNLKDVKRFLGRFNISKAPKAIKNRNDGARSVFEFLCRSTREELIDLISESSSGDGEQSPFAKLADHIIGNRGEDSAIK